MATEIGTLCLEASNFGQISYPGSSPKIGFNLTTQGIQDFGLRLSITKDVLEALNDDNVCMIGVYGMGGVGKTTMVNKLVERVKEGNLYDKVVMAVVSQTPNLEKIQSDIMEQLGLNVDEKALRAKRLSDWFMDYDKKILLILDDVWDELNFEAIGIPSASEKFKRHKILLTSRNKDVCTRLESQRNFEIKVLEDEEARNLFRTLVNIPADQDLCKIAEDIVAECGGLPISIVTIASALKNKPKYVWDDALQKLKKSNMEGVSGMEKVHSRIELSYNYLKDREAKSCLLLCSLFPEDFNVPVESLVRYGMSLQLFKDVADFHEARARVSALIDELKYSFLLLNGDDDSGESVKMHDVIRDVAISIASRDKHYLAICDAVVKKWPDANGCKDSTAISIFCKEIKELPTDIECPKLQFLWLHYQSSAEDLKYNVFSGMKQLKVLVLDVPSLPKSLDFPKYLRTLCLRNFELGQLPKEIGDLISLEILEIGTKYLEELPKEIALLKNLKLLDLMNIERLDHIPSDVLSKLSKLEELYVTWRFGKWESAGDREETNASLGELDSLCLTALQIWVPNLLTGLPKSIFRNLRRFDILISDHYPFLIAGKYVYQGNRLCIDGGSVAEIKQSGICSLLRKTEDLRLKKVVNLKSIYELSDDGFPQLREISIDYCNELEYVVDATILQGIPVAVLSKLESLELSWLNNLKEIWHGLISKIKPLEIQFPSFNSLQSIDISFCEKLEYVFPLSVARGMRQLKEMKISCCENMEGIFYKEEVDDEKITANEVEFPNLKLLKLAHLPKLKGFWVDTQVMADGMEQPINASNAISTLFPSPNFLCMSNLQTLSLQNCCLLKVAFAASAAQQLVQLKSLVIRGCEKMEYVVGVADERQEETVFPMLNSLRLWDLSELVAFCVDGHVSLNCHSLKELNVAECPKLKTFGLERRGREQESIEAQNKHIFTSKEDVPFCGDGQVSSDPDCLKQLKLKVCPKFKIFGRARRGREQESRQPQNKHHFPNQEVSLIKNGDSFIGDVNDHSAFIPYDFMERLLNLESLAIRDCNTLKVIFSFQEHHAAVGVVNSLRTIYLYNLSNLIHIWFKVPSEIMGFQSLQELTVYNCGNLIHIFPPHLPKLLIKLRLMWIRSCEKMEAIVGKEDEEAPESELDKIEFPRLQVLELEKLPNLKCFCGGTSAVELHSFESLKIDGCNQMKSFSYGPSNTPKLKKITIRERSCALEGDINGTMKKEVIPDSMEQPNASNGSPQVISTLFPSPSWLCLSNIQNLILMSCSPLKIAMEPSVAQQLGQLQSLEIHGCEKMEYVVGVADGIQEEKVFPMLNSLELSYLPDLVGFCADDHVSLNGHSLKQLHVVECPKIKSIGGSTGLLITGRDQQSIEPQNQHLLSSKQVALIKNGDSFIGDVNDHSAFIPYDFMERLLNLESLEIRVCDTLKVIFSFQEHHAAVGVVNSLRMIYLYKLSNLTHIWFKVSSEIMGFQSLKELRVSACGNLRHIFPPHLPKLLVKLQRMWIYSCEKMEAIVGKEDEEEPESVLDKIEFPQLQLLELEELPNLKGFCGGTSAVELQSLESLKIEGCNQMKSFSYGPSNTPKLKEITINNIRYALEGDINGTMKKEVEPARALAEEERVEGDNQILNYGRFCLLLIYFMDRICRGRSTTD